MKLQLTPLFAHDNRTVLVSAACTSIGRSDDCDIQLPDRSVSRHHCELIVDGGQAFVRDLQSRNGTLVNNHRVCDEHPLRDRDVLAIANTFYQVAMIQPEEQRPCLYDRLLKILRSRRRDASVNTEREAEIEAEDGGMLGSTLDANPEEATTSRSAGQGDAARRQRSDSELTRAGDNVGGRGNFQRGEPQPGARPEVE